jgi:hypothetical protein
MAALYGFAVTVFGAAYWLVPRLMPAVWRLRHFDRELRRGLVPSVVGAATFSVLILVFSAVASSLRASSGYDLEPTSAGLWLVYLVPPTTGAALGAALAGPGRRAAAGLLALASVVAFMAMLLPLSELTTACYANVTLVLRPSC